jgi:hypothetical protein
MIKNHGARHFLLFFVLAIVLFPGNARSEDYVNEEWGLTVATPQGALECKPKPQRDDEGNEFFEHDHGPLYFLDGSPNHKCSDETLSPSISIFAFYDTSEGREDLPKFVRKWCHLEPHATCSAGPKGLKFGPLESRSIFIAHPVTSDRKPIHGWVDIEVYAQGEKTTDEDGFIGNINYIATLRTKPEFLKRDLPKFREFLSQIKVVTPQP